MERGLTVCLNCTQKYDIILTKQSVNLRFSKLYLPSVYILLATCYTEPAKKPKEDK